MKFSPFTQINVRIKMAVYAQQKNQTSTKINHFYWEKNRVGNKPNIISFLKLLFDSENHLTLSTTNNIDI